MVAGLKSGNPDGNVAPVASPAAMNSVVAAEQLFAQAEKEIKAVLDAIDAFIAAGARNRKPKPMNLWRKLKIRKRIGYWGPA